MEQKLKQVDQQVLSLLNLKKITDATFKKTKELQADIEVIKNIRDQTAENYEIRFFQQAAKNQKTDEELARKQDHLDALA